MDDILLNSGDASKKFSKKISPLGKHGGKLQKFTPQLIVWGSFIAALFLLILLTQYTLRNSLKQLGILADDKEFSLSQDDINTIRENINKLGNPEDVAVTFKYSTVFEGDVTFEQEITAPNVLYSLSAGEGISITGDPQNPVISVTDLPEEAVTSIEEINGDIDLEAGDNVTISTDGNKIRISSKTFSTPGQLTESEVEAFIFDGDNTGLLSSGTLGLSSLSYEGTLPASTLVGNYTGITGVGTLGGLTVSGSASIGGDTLFIDSSNDRVGIGTTAPSTTLDVNGSAAIGSQLSVGSSASFSSNVSISGALTASSTATFNSGIVVGGEFISDFMGTGLTLNSGTLSVSLAAGSGLTSTSTGISLLRTCSASQVLAWSGTEWECSTVGGVGGTINKTGSPESGFVTFWSGTSAISGESTMFYDTSTNRLGIGTTTPAYALDVTGAIQVGTTAVVSGGISLNGDYVTDFTGTGLSNAGGSLGLSSSGVTAGSYGSSVNIPVITVDQYGRITAATEQSISYDNYGRWVLSAGGELTNITSGATVSVSGGTGIGISNSGGTVTLYNTGVTSLLGTTNRITASGSTGAITLNLPQDIHTGATVQFAGITIGGDTITEFMGNGLTVSGNALGLRLATGSGVGLTASFSGLELGSSGLGLISGCSDTQIMMWSGGQWICSSIGGAGGVGQNGSPASGYLTYWYNGNTITGESALYYDSSNDRVGIGTTVPGQSLSVAGNIGIREGGSSPEYFTIFQGGDQSGNVTYTLPVGDGSTGYVLTTNGSGVLSWQSVTGGAVGAGDISAVGNVTSGDAFTSGTPGSSLFFTSGGYAGLGASAGRIQFYDNATDTISLAGGNVGIGTTSASSLLEVNGTFSTAGTATFSGGISVNGDYITDLTGTGLSNAGGALGLATSGVTAGTYGSASSVPVVSVDAYGRINTISTAAIAGGYQNWVLNAAGSASTITSGSTVSFTGSTGLGVSHTSGSVTLYNSGVTSLAGTTNQITASAATGAVTLSLPQNIHTGATVQFAGLTVGGDTITEFMGNGLTVSSNTLSLRLASGSGLEFSSGSVSMLRSCGTNEVLAWNGSAWACASISGVGGLTKTGSPDSGYLTFWSGTNTLTGVSALYTDGTNIGIGTTAPAARLDVAGASWLRGGTGASGLYVNSSGNVGIGTTSPTTLLHLKATSPSLRLESSNSSYYAQLTANFSSGTPVTLVGYNGVNIISQYNDGQDVILGNTTTASPPRVGIGTVSPSYRLDVNSYVAGNSIVAGFFNASWPNNHNSIIIGTNGSSGRSGVFGFLDNSNGTSGFATVSVSGDDPLAGTGLIVKKGGSVGIGTTNPTYKLDVVGSVGISTTAVVGGGISLGGDYISDFTGTGLSNAGGTLGLSTTGVTAGTYGSASSVPVVSVDAYGRINTISTAAIAGGYQNWVLNAAGSAQTISTGSTVSFTGSTGLGVSHSAGSITLYNSGVTSLAGTTNQITASAATGAVTLSLPQNIHTGATVQFAQLGIGATTSGVGLNVSNTAWLRGGTGDTGLFVNSSGNVGIGTTNPSSPFELVTQTPTYEGANYYNGQTALIHGNFEYAGADNDYNNLFSNIRVGSTTNNSEIISALAGSIFVPSGNTANHGQIFGINTRVSHEGSGTVTNARGMLVDARNTTGTITNFQGIRTQLTNTALVSNFYGIEISSLTNTSGTISNTYGIYVGDITSGTQTNTPFSFYASDSNAYNYFAGNVGIGNTNPTYKLDVNGAVGIGTTAVIGGGISLNGDYITDLTGTGLSNAGGTLGLSTTGVVAGTYGSSTNIPVVSVDAYGRINSVTNQAVSFDNYGSWVATNGITPATITSGSTVTFTGGTGIGVSSSGSTFTFHNSGVTSLAGTTNQITASAATGAVTLSLPQNIHTGATVQFAQLGIGATTNGVGLNVSNTAWLRGGTGATGLFVNSSGNVGIGTTSPTQALHVAGSARITGALYDSSNSAGSSGMVLSSTGTGTTWASLSTLGIVGGTGTDNYLSRWNSAGTGLENGTLVDNATTGLSLNIDSSNNVGIGGTSANVRPSLYVGANGNVGIGTTGPTTSLQIGSGGTITNFDNGAGGTFTPSVVTSLTSGVAGMGVSVNDGTNNRRAALFVNQTSGLWGLSQTFSSANIPFVITSGGNERLRIDTSGRFGIGTTAPSTLLSLGDTTYTFAASGLSFGDGDTGLYESADDKLNIRTNGSDRLTILSDGSLGIGTTAPTQKLEVAGNQKIAGGSLYVTPGTPIVAGTVADSTNFDVPQRVAVQGKYAYVTATGNGTSTPDSFSVIDISTPSTPVRISTIGSVNDADLNGAQGVVVNGNYAYVMANASDQITVIDISNPNSPTVVGRVSSASQLDAASSIYIQGRYLYAAAHADDRITIVDIADPTNPTIISSSAVDTTNSNGIYNVKVQGKYAYTAIRNGSDSLPAGSHLQIFDISNPTAITSVGIGATSASLVDTLGIDVSGRYAYLTGADSDSLVIYDVSNPASPAIVGTLVDATNLNGAHQIVVSGKYAYISAQVGDRFTIVDVSNPASPTVHASYNSSTNMDSPIGLVLSGRYAYVVNSVDDMLTILDIGSEIPSLYASNLTASNLHVEDDAMIRNNILAGGSLLLGGNLSTRNGLSSYYTSTAATAGTEYGNRLIITDTGAISSGTDTTYGLHSAVTRTGASGGILNTYGGYFSATGDTAGTSTAIGLYATASGADNNYAAIFENGNVGIGTTVPSAQLELEGTSIFSTSSTVTSGNDSIYLDKNGLTSGQNNFGASIGFSRLGANLRKAAISSVQTGSNANQTGLAFFGSSGTSNGDPIEEFMRITHAGNVGIGTTSPVTKLDVAGTAWLRGTTASTGGVYVDGSGNVGLGMTNPTQRLDVNGYINATSTSGTGSYRVGTWGVVGGSNLQAMFGGIESSQWSRVGLYTSGTEKMTIDTNGNVGIGTTNPASKLDVAGGYVSLDNGDFAGSRGIRFRNTTDTTTPTGGGMYFANNNILYLQAGTANSITFRKNDGNAYAEFGYNNGKTSLNIPTGGLIRPYEADSQTALQIATYNGSTPYVNFDSTNQRVGIGTTTPSYKLDVVSTSTTGILNLTGNSITSGTGVNLSLNALSTGTGFNILSTSTALTTGRLMNLDWSPSSTATATGDLLRLNIGPNGTLTGNLLALYNNGSELFKVSTSKITSAIPHEFTASGDVSVANDLIFTDQIANTIQTYGPLTIESGEVFENQNLTLRTFGTGNMVFELGGSGDTVIFDGSTGNVGIGVTSILDVLHVGGDIRIGTGTTGCVKDADGTTLTGSCSSDANLKTNIAPINSLLEKFVQLNPVTYKWNETAAEVYKYGTSETQIGLIAQNVESVFPELVTVDTNGYRQVNFSSLPIYTMQALKELKLSTDGDFSDLKSQLSEIDKSIVTQTEFDGLQGDVEVLKQQYDSLSESMEELLADVDINEIKSLVPAVEELKLRAQLTDDKMASMSARISFLEENLLNSSGAAVLGATSDGSLATSSATLSSLAVTGETNLYDVGISGTINAGLLTINGFDDSLEEPAVTINTIGGPLKIQPLRLESVDFMDGKVSIDTQGNMKVLGRLIADVVRTKKLEIVEPVEATETTPNTTEQKSIGESTLTAGESEIIIETPSVTEASRIYVTFNGEYGPATRYWIAEKIKGKSFTIKLDAAVDADVDFSWLIVN